MCSTVKSPTPKPPTEKKPVYMRNPWLDGLGIGAESRGRSSLRIDLGGRAPTPDDVSRPASRTGTGQHRGAGGAGGGRGLGIMRREDETRRYVP